MVDGLTYLTRTTWAYEAARALHVANALGVFSLLDGRPMTAGEIAEHTGADDAMLEKLLIGCCAMNLLERSDGKYSNSEIADQYLVEGRPLYQGHNIAFSARVWNRWDQLEDTIRSGRVPCPGAPVPDATPEQRRYLSMAMHNLTMAGRGELFTTHIDLAGRKRMFDVGGGPGTYSILACQKNPELRATVFDLPNTIPLAREMITRERLQDRIDTQAGNWDDEEFGRDNDVVLLSNVLHGPHSNASMKLQKAFRSMVSGGLLVAHDFVLDDEKSGPLIPAMFNLWAGAFSARELIAEIVHAGFENPRIAASSESLGSTWITATRPE
jgi:3-hydroxy-5-methyl-1-naphthoate 3-O-methyltransferase